MKQYALNFDLSRNLYEEHKEDIKSKNCYHNIFNVLIFYPENFRRGEWKIAYGYVKSVENIYCRHCFIFNGEEVIDPTVFTTNRDNKNRTYYITKVFDSAGDYLEALEAEGDYPALQKHLRKEDKKAQEWARENGCIFIGLE